MNPTIVGAWDGTHIWLQWDATDAPRGYDVSLRFKSQKVKEWGDWQPPIHSMRPWLSAGTTRTIGTQVQARIAVTEDAKKVENFDWVNAVEAKFNRCLCNFEFASSKKNYHFVEGTNFHCTVDGAVCSYSLTNEIEVALGTKVVSEMKAMGPTGFAQLDNENDFYIRPALGLTIRNTESSREDVEATGRDFTVLSVMRGPITLAVKKRPDVR